MTPNESAGHERHRSDRDDRHDRDPGPFGLGWVVAEDDRDGHDRCDRDAVRHEQPAKRSQLALAFPICRSQELKWSQGREQCARPEVQPGSCCITAYCTAVPPPGAHRAAAWTPSAAATRSPAPPDPSAVPLVPSTRHRQLLPGTRLTTPCLARSCVAGLTVPTRTRTTTTGPRAPRAFGRINSVPGTQVRRRVDRSDEDSHDDDRTRAPPGGWPDQLRARHAVGLVSSPLGPHRSAGP